MTVDLHRQLIDLHRQRNSTRRSIRDMERYQRRLEDRIAELTRDLPADSPIRLKLTETLR